MQIQQNLLKDAFGYAYRKRLDAARKGGDALRWKTRGEIEDQTLKFIDIFYQAWLNQQQVFSLRAEVSRRKNLVKAMRRKFRKGVIGRPELIQIQAVLAQSETNLSRARNVLRFQWESLVKNLKLPSDFMNINPIEIPTVIDNPLPRGVRVCAQAEPQTTADIQALENENQSLASELNALSSDTWPDLKLVAGYSGNGINGSGQATVDQVFGARPPAGLSGLGPAWNVGLKLNWPLDNSINRAERVRSGSQKNEIVPNSFKPKTVLKPSGAIFAVGSALREKMKKSFKKWYKNKPGV